MKDLCFHNGKLDENYLYGKIRNKCNILQEIIILRRALNPFKHLFSNHDPHGEVRDTRIEYNISLRSKYYYESLVEQKREKPKYSILITNQIKVDNMQIIHIARIKKIHDYKIAEFNYKVLNNILSCNTNLKIWRHYTLWTRLWK